jgi:hypothetical protein
LLGNLCSVSAVHQIVAPIPLSGETLFASTNRSAQNHTSGVIIMGLPIGKRQEAGCEASTKLQLTKDPPPQTAHAFPDVWAWVAHGIIDAHGNKVPSSTNGAVEIIAVSVHEDYPSTLDARLALLREVPQQIADRHPPNMPSLWVYPGGYFGFDPVCIPKTANQSVARFQ